MFTIYYLRLVLDYLRDNKKIVGLISALLLFLGGLYAYNEFYRNPENIVNFSNYGENDTSEVEKTISKKSTLGKDLPYAEEIIKVISEKNASNTEGVSYEFDDIILEEFGEQVSLLYNAGLIPSTILTESENTQIILAGNAYLQNVKAEDESGMSNYFGADTIVLSKNYIDSLGELIPDYSENPALITRGKTFENASFSNITGTLENSSLKINGVFLDTIPQVTEEDTPSEVLALLYNKYDGGSNLTTVAEVNEVTKGNYILTVNFIINKNMSIEKIKKELAELKLGEATPLFLDYTNIPQETVDSLSSNTNMLGAIEKQNGSDYEIASFSVLQASFYFPEDTSIFQTSNYLSLGKTQIELSPINTIAYDNNMLYTDYGF